MWVTLGVRRGMLTDTPLYSTELKPVAFRVIGIGSIECHGRHMPLGTDTIIPDFLLDRMEENTDVLICPTAWEPPW